MFKKQKFILFSIAFLALFAFAISASAQTYGLEYSSVLELGTRGLKSMVFTAINVILSFLGVLAMSIILYAGFLWMSSGGNPEKVNKAKRVLVSAVIGMALIIFSYAIAQFIMKSLTDVTGGGGGMAGSPCDCVTELGFCAPSTCLRCTEISPLPSQVCKWLSDLTCPGCTVTTNFTAQKFSPPVDHPDPTIRNAVIRVSFSQNVGGAVDDVSFIVHDITSGLNVIGTRATIGKRIEFTPNTPCPAPHGAWNCFDANHNFTITVSSLAGAGILRLSDGTELTCNVMTPCTASFNVGTIIDTQNPTNLNFSLAGNLCIESPNDLTAGADDDSAISIFEFSDDHTPAFSFTDNAPVCNGATPNHCDGAAIWMPTAIGGYIANNNYTLTVKATDLDSNNISANKNVRLRAAHCCNLTADLIFGAPILDGGPAEEGFNCGGECAACSGTACGNDLNTDCIVDPSCAANSDRCASGLCSCTNDAIACSGAGYTVDPCCLCQEAPIIDCITPNDTDSCSPHGIPIGTAGNLISIWGRNFGVYGPGSQVEINGIVAPLAKTVNLQCDNTWTDTQIIVVVPPGAVNGAIEVTADSGYSDATNDGRGLAIPNFSDDLKVRPGLCKVKNIEIGSACLGLDCGFYEEEVRGHGLNIFVGSIIEFGNEGSNVAGLSPTPIPDLEIDCGVPNIQSGNVGFRAKSAGGDYGNYLNFRVTNSLTGPRIDYIEPVRGPEGQYVTIYGSGFTNNHAGNTVTFDGFPRIDGDFNFPPECEVSYWQNNRIIVKVPTGAITGDVIVTVGIENSNGASFEVCVVGPGCELLPGMCRLSPVFGPINTLTDIHGEHFGAAMGDVEFYDGDPAFPNISAAAIGAWLDISINNAQVPGGTQSGPVYVIDSGLNRSSNSIPFEVGDCDGDDANCPAGTICCPDGACYIGSCPVPNFSTYTWRFTTGDYFVREECDTTKPCLNGTGPCDPIVPSPTPWINRAGGGDVCTNAAIGASFSEIINEITVDDTTVLIQECTGPVNNPCSAVGLNLINFSDPFVYHNTAIGEIEAFEFHPTALLNQDKWYQVTLLGGVGGVTTVAGNPLIDDYIWHFKTRNDAIQCEIGRVAVNPNPAKLVMAGATQNFTATLFSKDNPCIIINSLGQTKSWASDNPLIATVINQNAPTTTATAVGSGKVYIKATVMPDNKTGKALLEVDFQGLSIIDHWYDCDSVCINAEMGLRFDSEVNPISLTTGAGNNINIYDCVADPKGYVDLLSIPIALTDPSPPYFWNAATGDSFTTFSAGGNFNQNSYYRAIIQTGASGIKSILGDHLIILNSNLAFGEECDNLLDPLCDNTFCLWTGDACGISHQECYPAGSKGCSANCLNTGPVANTCDDGVVDANYENCDDGNQVSGDGCSSRCLYEGSTGTAVCGNDIIEFGEACDDGNQTLGDGCNDKCLREGADFGATKITALGTPYKCGDGAPAEQDANGAGEDCDDGNDINGDGCSNKCLSEGVKSSVCGDGKIGIGEDCDDGNTDIKDGCSNICLNEGSMGLAECGNGEVEKNENDAYSWVFKTKSDPDALCALNSVEVIPSNVSAFIGDILNYRSIGRSSPDSCDPRGQSINPLNYDWGWNSDDATIANLIFPLQDTELAFGDIDPFQRVSAIALGTTNINASTTNIFGDIITGSGVITVKEESLPGVPCISGVANCCQSGVNSCPLGYSCMDNGSNDCGVPFPGTINECYCCCSIEAQPTSTDSCLAPLVCTPEVDSCKGNYRGWCCGCEDDADCAPLSLLCGNDTCCRSRPAVSSTMPNNGDADVCRNVLISADFNQEMKKSSLRNNFELYKSDGCPLLDAAVRIDTRADGLVSYWDFDDGAGSSVLTDRFGSNDGTLQNMDPNTDWVAGKFGSALEFEFDGVQGEYVDIGDKGSDWPQSTIMAWIYPETFSGLPGNNTMRAIVQINVYYLGAWDDSAFYLQDGFLKAYHCGIGNTKLQLNKWSHVVMVNDGTNISYYLNGNPDGVVATHPVWNDGWEFIKIGGGYDVDYETFDGFIDEVAIYNRVLSAQEIQDIYNCSIKGSISSYNTAGKTTVEFAPKNNLSATTTYTVVIKGDPDLADTIFEGVLSKYGIAMDGPTAGNNYTWDFKTGEIICDIDYIKVDVEVGDAPYPSNITYDDMSSDIFLCAGKDDCARDAATTTPENQHLFYASAIDDQTGNILNPDDFDWTWTETDSQDIFSFLNSATTTADLTANPINGKAYLNIEAISNGTVDYGEAKKKMTINSFMCENPWPDIKYWPWEDWIIHNPTADCDIAGTCNETYLEMFYCRDDGEGGVLGDLPMISIDPVVRSEDDEILKEMFFIVGDIEGFGGSSGGPSITNASISPCSGANGTLFTITADIYDIDGINGPTAIAKVQLPDETDLAPPVNIFLLDDGIMPDTTGGDGTYTGSWTSAGCAGDCAYFVDIIVCDLAGDCSEEENILCL